MIRLKPIRIRSALQSLISGGLAFGLMLAISGQAQEGAAPVAPADQVVKLKPFEVTDQKTGGYHVSTSSTATRANVALIDIPQTVDIVTKEFWNDISATTFDQSFRYVANVYVRNRNAISGDGVNLRGFETNGSIFVDGVRIGNYKRDLVGYDRLEIVKGPPSAVQGRAGGTGLLNYILKKPVLGQRSTEAKYTFGWDEFEAKFNRAEIDANAPLNRSGTLAGRVAASWQKSDDYIKFNEVSNLAVYPSLRWQVTPRTEIMLVNEFLKLNTPSRDEGHGFAVYPEKLRRLVPQFDTNSDPITALHLPANFNLIGPDNKDKENVNSMSLFLTHHFNDWLFSRQVGHLHFTRSDSITYAAEDNLHTVAASQRTQTIGTTAGTVTQGDLVANYAWPHWLKGSTMLGNAYSDNTAVTDNYAGIPDKPFNVLDIVAVAATGNSINYYNGRTTSVFPRTSYSQTNAYNFGIYADQNLGLFNDRLLLSGGIRADHDHSKTLNRVTGATSGGADTTLNSFRYGATFKILPKLAAYVVKSVQNDPIRTIQRYNGLLAGDPRLAEFFTVTPFSELKEIGLKGEVFGGRLSASGDYWQMKREGSVVNILTNGVSQGQNVTFGTQTLISGAKSAGYEFSAYGSITDRLSLIANYTRMITSQQNPAAPLTGARIPLRFAPTWNFNTFLKYSFRDSHEQGWIIKGGISAIGPFWAQVTGPGLTYIPHRQKLLDAGAAYRWKRYDFDLMASNLANDPFLITRDMPPRNYRFSVSTRF